MHEGVNELEIKDLQGLTTIPLLRLEPECIACYYRFLLKTKDIPLVPVACEPRLLSWRLGRQEQPQLSANQQGVPGRGAEGVLVHDGAAALGPNTHPAVWRPVLFGERHVVVREVGPEALGRLSGP